MKKKLLEKDIFYLSLFICVCLVAFGGILFTNKNLNKLVASKDTINKDNEINLVKEKNDSVPTSTESKENLEKAKEQNNKKTETKSESKLNYIGTEVLREYSADMPSYSKTLDVWEIHKGLDIAAKDGDKIRSILDGTVKSVYSDERYGTSIELSYADNITVIYSGIKENVSLEKGDTVKEGEVIGYIGQPTKYYSKEGSNLYFAMKKDGEPIDPIAYLP